MLPIILFQFTIFSLYIYYLIKNYGVLSSISESYYVSGEKRTFQFFCFLLGLPLVFYPDPYFILAAFALVVVGISDDYTKEASRLINKAHFIGAGVAIGASLIALGLEYIIVFSWGLLPLLFVRNRVWWIEIWAFLVIIIGLFIKFII